MAQDDLIVFRDLGGGLRPALDEYAESLGVTRSAAIRLLLETGLGNEAQLAAVREAVAASAALVRPIVLKAIKDLNIQVADDLTESLGD